MLELNQIYQGDCLELLKQIDDNSIDAIVTDPPYGLTSIKQRFGKENSAPAKYGKDGSFARLSGGFMGKKWDGSGIEYNVDMWQECFRVLKPGGYLLSFGGTRTYHRMACAIEDAGFEIRDMVEWIYGSGFPKSHNIGKAVDKKLGNEREVVGTTPYKVNGNITSGNFGTTAENNPDKRFIANITKGNSEWEGWGTALKPAHEPICMARKPLSEKTVADNCLKWGTGGINIDGSRVETDDENRRTVGGFNAKSNIYHNDEKYRINTFETNNPQGRFPANLIHDGSDEVVALFPNNSARFFYCAKASKSERNMGLDEIQEPSLRPSGVAFNEHSGIHSEKHKGNHHPTVKPIALMEYLIKLVSKEGALILDPFAGSGSTLIAAMNLDRNFIGIEQEEEYCEIASHRLAKAYIDKQKEK